MILMVNRNQSIEKLMLRIISLRILELKMCTKVLVLNLISQKVLDQSQPYRKGLVQSLTYQPENLLMSKLLLDSRLGTII